MSTALLLVDIQNDYFSNGAMELEGSEAAGRKAGKLLKQFRQNNLPVIHIQHVANRPNATFFLPDTEGVKIHSSVYPLPDEIIFKKHYPSSFRDTPLLSYLQKNNINELVIAGMMTHMCIDTTTRAAFDLGFKCYLAHDACATKSLTFDGQHITAAHVQLAYLAALNGLFAQVESTDVICSRF